jgi:hypothetical protein
MVRSTAFEKEAGAWRLTPPSASSDHSYTPNERVPMSQSMHSAISPEQLALHRSVKAPQIEPMTRGEVVELAKNRLKLPFTPIFGTVMALSARQPSDGAYGNLDVYMPGRWDTTSDLIFMDAIVTGTTGGEWTGSVGYVKFTPKTTGNHLVAVHFTGSDITMRLHGPWGTQTAMTTSVTQTGVVLALWSGNAEQSLSFQIDCVAPSDLPGLGYIKSIQAFN